MKFLSLLIIVLALLVGCQGTRQERSDLNQVVTEVYNPSLLALQFMTVKIKSDKGKWPESSTDYVSAFGDSAKVVLADFDKLSFGHSSDTLKINYTLKEPRQKPSIEFVDLERSRDSSEFKFDSRVKQIETRKRFEVNEGMLTVFNSNKFSTSIMHEYSAGAALKKITHAQQ